MNGITPPFGLSLAQMTVLRNATALFANLVPFPYHPGALPEANVEFRGLYRSGAGH
jgi:hypothetical protein